MKTLAVDLGDDAVEKIEQAARARGISVENFIEAALLEAIERRADNDERAKRDFLLQLAHELATPLAALQNQIDFLEDATLRGRPVRNPEGQFVYLREQADFLNYLVRDIQYQFGRGGMIRPRFEFSRVDLKPTIERVKKLLLPTARIDKRIDILTATTRMPLLYLDARRMEQVIFNLLQNSVKYSLVGSGNICIRYDLVDEAESSGNPLRWHRLTFQDHGIGIPTDDLPRIFEEYRRGSNVGSAPSGTGLGLAVAKRIVEAHGGRLSVIHRSRPTELAVDLPHELMAKAPPNANSVD